MQHKVGALGGGNDLESGTYTLQNAALHCLKMPRCVGFTYQGVPNQQGQLMCYFKSSGEGNQDPNWQTYLKGPGAPHLGGGGQQSMTPRQHGGGQHGGGHRGGGRGGGHRGRGFGGRAGGGGLPQGADLLSKNHPTVSAGVSGVSARDGLNLQEAIAWCTSIPNCTGMWYYDNGRTCPKASFAPNSFTKVMSGANSGGFYQIKRGRPHSAPARPGPRGQVAAAATVAVAGAAVAAAQEHAAQEEQKRLAAEQEMRRMQLYQKATTLKSQQQYAAAADAFEEAIRAGHKEGALCHNEKGECYEELGQLDKAVHEFDRALQHDGENPSYLYVRSLCLTCCRRSRPPFDVPLPANECSSFRCSAAHPVVWCDRRTAARRT